MDQRNTNSGSYQRVEEIKSSDKMTAVTNVNLNRKMPRRRDAEKNLTEHVDQPQVTALISLLAQSSQAGDEDELKKFRDFRSLYEQNPGLYQYAVECLKAERKDLKKQIRPAVGEERNDLQRRLWVVDGMLLEGLNSELLEHVAENWRRRGAVPHGYAANLMLSEV